MRVSRQEPQRQGPTHQHAHQLPAGGRPLNPRRPGTGRSEPGSEWVRGGRAAAAGGDGQDRRGLRRDAAGAGPVGPDRRDVHQEVRAHPGHRQHSEGPRRRDVRNRPRGGECLGQSVRAADRRIGHPAAAPPATAARADSAAAPTRRRTAGHRRTGRPPPPAALAGSVAPRARCSSVDGETFVVESRRPDVNGQPATTKITVTTGADTTWSQVTTATAKMIAVGGCATAMEFLLHRRDDGHLAAAEQGGQGRHLSDRIRRRPTITSGSGNG